MRPATVGCLLVVALAGGALGDPFLPDEVPFEVVERRHFDAFAVVADTKPPSDAPLILRVRIVGDAADAPIDRAVTWLRDHAGVVVIEDARGAPLFLTRGDLAATSGRGTLGATISTGMAVEVADARTAPCVVAHELLHFVGLRHVSDPRNIMYPHCLPGALDKARIEPWQRARVASVGTISATTPQGVVTWASR